MKQIYYNFGFDPFKSEYVVRLCTLSDRVYGTLEEFQSVHVPLNQRGGLEEILRLVKDLKASGIAHSPDRNEGHD